ncbi:amidohydrolase family protein [Xylariaceae sp. FL1651]|nr:amidohydrolase family protein [Xylariaceae sp. FL1651]
MTTISKIDVHHHIIPPQLDGINHGLAGMKVPEWSISSDATFSESIGVRTRILSVSTPGVTFISDPEESAKVARSINEYCASLRDSDPLAYGFFATVPSLEHTELVLRELRYAFDTLHADGVTLFTSYASPEGYLGHPEYVPIWEELNARKAVVFVHPINNKAAVYFDERLPMPAFDWPHETGRTAMDMILNRRLQQFPDVKIILSHGGGTLAMLIHRATMISLPEFGSAMSAEDMVNQAKSFYFDLALSGSKEMFPLILGFAKEGHLLFGSDFPHATVPFSQSHSRFIDEYDIDDEKRKEIYHGAAKKLFPRLNGVYDA